VRDATRGHPYRLSISASLRHPYFGWEKNSEEPTQSYVKFPTQKQWLHGFTGQTLRNCARGLKRNGILAINIASAAAFSDLAR
jgi:hypothetical protein